MDAMRGTEGFAQLAVLDASGVAYGLADTVAQSLAFPCDRPLRFRSPGSFFAACGEMKPDIFIVDLETLGQDEDLRRLASRHPQAVLIAASRHASVSRTFAAMQAGAHDLVEVPFDPSTLARKIDRLFGRTQRAPAAASSDTAAKADMPSRAQARREPVRPTFERFIGGSARMTAIYDQISRIAPSSAPVFITGESGTGKELCAEAVHRRSPRADKPFVAINCAAIPRELMESEIFGHARGAFTGAIDARKGAAERADGGTLFLDEVGELDLPLQSKLLRFVQTGEVQRVGATTASRVDVRIICATNRNPLEEITAGRFREDLFYRLHVLPVHLPPLRERREDILPLTLAFLERFAAEEGRDTLRLEPDAEERLVAYAWPGNVRQLENLMRQAVVLNDSDRLAAAMLPPFLSAESPPTPRGRTGIDRHIIRRSDAIEPLWAQERRIIEQALDAFDGNIAQAAAALEISPSTIYRKRQSWNERAL